MNFIKQNIKYLRTINGYGQEKMADILNCTRDNIASYERGTEPKIDFILNLVNYFHISLEDFVKEDLSLRNDNVGDEEWIKNIKTSKPETEYILKTDKRIESQHIPLYNTQAAAGLTKMFSDPPNVLDHISIPNLPKCDGAIYITGDSMYPLLKSGDIIAYKRIKDIINGILWGEMYLLSFLMDDEDFTMVKYVQKSDLGSDFVKLVSQNQHHQPKDILMKNITALALIKASIRFNSMN